MYIRSRLPATILAGFTSCPRARAIAPFEPHLPASCALVVLCRHHHLCSSCLGTSILNFVNELCSLQS